MSNTQLWDRVCKTDPAQVKEITGKQYKGNSPKPFYIVRRLTEEFGPCGIGWGFTILSERMERLTETDMLHVAVVRFWYVMGEKRGELEQIGQTKAVYAKSAGGMMVDEDAPKKSVTDALVKCASYLGFAGDIFAGRWDDSKYVAELKREFAEASSAMAPELLLEWSSHIEQSKNSTELKTRLAEAIEAAGKDSKAIAKFNATAAAKIAAARAKQQAKETA